MQRVTPQVKAHISVLLALLSLVKAADYWFQRYALTFSTRGFVEGATYTDVKAQLPALNLLMFIALLSCGLFIYNIWRRGLGAADRWPSACGPWWCWWPAPPTRRSCRSSRCCPTESSKEAPYIEHNIAATRQALNMTDGQGHVAAVRPADLCQRHQQGHREQPRARCRTSGCSTRPTSRTPTRSSSRTSATPPSTTSTSTATRSPRPRATRPRPRWCCPPATSAAANVPQKSWEGQHISYTHGYGLALSAANAVSTGGSPDYLIRDVPTAPHVEPKDADVKVPQVYFSENQTRLRHRGQQPATRSTTSTRTARRSSYRYTGKGGVAMNSWLRKAAFAARFGDWNPLISNFVTDESNILYVRDIKERVNKVAPFLQYDNDPYPVLADGKIQYVIDAYTTSDHYPNAQKASTEGLDPRQRAEHQLQLRAQLGEGHRRCLRGHGEDVRDRSRRSDHPGLPQRLPEAVHRHRRAARDDAGAPALPGGPVQGADHHVGPLPHRRSAVVLRPDERVERGQGPGHHGRGRHPDGHHQRRRPDRPQGRPQDRPLLPHHEVTGAGQGVVRPLPVVRPHLRRRHQTEAHRVHGRQQRPGQLRAAAGLRGAEPAPGRPVRPS